LRSNPVRVVIGLWIITQKKSINVSREQSLLNNYLCFVLSTSTNCCLLPWLFGGVLSPRLSVYSVVPPEGRYCPETGVILPVWAITFFCIPFFLLSRRVTACGCTAPLRNSAVPIKTLSTANNLSPINEVINYNIRLLITHYDRPVFENEPCLNKGECLQSFFRRSSPKNMDQIIFCPTAFFVPVIQSSSIQFPSKSMYLLTISLSPFFCT